MKKYKTDYAGIYIRLMPDTLNGLKLMAQNNKVPTSTLMREILEKYLARESIDENAGVVVSTIRKAMKDEIRAESDRLAKLIIKATKAAAAGMYVGAQAIQDIGQHQGQEALLDALEKAVKYIRLSYNPEDYVEKQAKTIEPAKPVEIPKLEDLVFTDMDDDELEELLNAPYQG